ncbi:MAG: IS5 family transposase [Pseudomonadota bacterium]|nr:IS5 family transposase [Pseudomonadota bacterium]
MSWKNLKQASLADALLVEHAALTELDGVHNLIDWQAIAAELADIHVKKRGEQAYPPIIMFKALLLQVWYNLSDPALEKQLARDLLFRRFVGLSLDQPLPDHSSLWRFRNLLSEQGRFERLLNQLNTQLAEAGLLIRSGQISIMDASVITASRNRPDKTADGRSTLDPEAAYNVKAGSDGQRRTTYGYKVHINVEEDGYINKACYTAGNVHDSQCLAILLTGEEHAVYADSAYASQAHDTLLQTRPIRNGILKRAYRNTPLSKAARQTSRNHSATRSIVERVSGVMKLHYGMGRARYLGLARNQARFMLMAFAYNLKRAFTIHTECHRSTE